MLKILEFIWLALAILGATAASYYSIIKGWHENTISFLIITLIAAAMYSIRRRQRKISEKEKPE